MAWTVWTEAIIIPILAAKTPDKIGQSVHCVLGLNNDSSELGSNLSYCYKWWADGRHGFRPVIAPSLSDDETSHENYHHHDERLLRRVFYVV